MQEVLRSIGTQLTGVGAAMLTSVSIQPSTLAIFSYSPAFLRDLHRMVSPTVGGARCLTAAPIPRHQLCRPSRLPRAAFDSRLRHAVQVEQNLHVREVLQAGQRFRAESRGIQLNARKPRRPIRRPPAPSRRCEPPQRESAKSGDPYRHCRAHPLQQPQLPQVSQEREGNWSVPLSRADPRY